MEDDPKHVPPSEERREDAKSRMRLPAAGPHAHRELTNPEATPGAGSLPDPEADDMGGVSS